MTLLDQTSGVLLVVAAAEESAKRIESYLRNAGHPLRTGWISDLEDLDDALRRSAPDMVLCEEGLPLAPHTRVLDLCAHHDPDLPVLLLGNGETVDASVAALAAGARDIVSTEDLPHLRRLELVVIREFVNYRNMRLLRTTRERLADFESRHQQLSTGTGDAVAYVQEGILSWANPAFAELLCYDCSEDLAGQPLIDLVASEQQSKIKERLRAVLKGKHQGEPLELQLVGRKGTVEVKAQLILGHQDGESVIEMLIRSPAIPVAMPGIVPPQLPGRGAFFEALRAPQDGKQVRAAMLLKIDDFDSLEQRLGHLEADEAVSIVTANLRPRLGAQDSLYPFSQDELAIVVNRSHFPEIEQFGELLRRELSNFLVATQAHESHITVSVAVFPIGSNDAAEEVVGQLAAEVRKLTMAGGNRFAVLGETAKAAQAEREDARRAAQLKKAIDEGRLALAYQSIASLEGEARDHFDVLVRMRDDDGKEYHAAEFMRAAQKFNLLRAIDRWVVARVLTVIAKRASGKDCPAMFVKLSEDTLKDCENFIPWLRETLRTFKLPPDTLNVEVQEHILQNHIRKAKLLTQALSELGIGLAIEHYGVGANSAQLLEHVSTTYVKFHPSFTQDFADKDIQKRLSQLMEVAKHRQIRTIVSHVEDANVMARLWQLGVNFVQGYHVQEPDAVPMSAESI